MSGMININLLFEDCETVFNVMDACRHSGADKVYISNFNRISMGYFKKCLYILSKYGNYELDEIYKLFKNNKYRKEMKKLNKMNVNQEPCNKNKYVF